MGRTQEKMAGANNGGVQAAQPSTPSFMPSFGKTSAPAPAAPFTPAPAPSFGGPALKGPAQGPQPEL
jgi:hypothetical protein